MTYFSYSPIGHQVNGDKRVKKSTISWRIPYVSVLEKMTLDDALKHLIERGFYVPKDKWETKLLVDFSTARECVFINGKKHAIFYVYGKLLITRSIKDVQESQTFILHNENGPALITGDGQFYFINGVQQTKNQVYLQRIKNVKK